MDVSATSTGLLDRIVENSVSLLDAQGVNIGVPAVEHIIAHGREQLAECAFAFLAFDTASNTLFKSLYSENAGAEHRKFCESVFISAPFLANSAAAAFDGSLIELAGSKTAEAGNLGNAVAVAHRTARKAGFILVVWRDKSFGPFGPPDLKLIGDLAHTACKILKVFALRDSDIRSNLGEFLDCLETGLFVVDCNFTIHHANRNAARILHDAHNVLRADERLFFEDAASRTRVERSLDFVLAQPHSPDVPAAPASVPLPNAHGRMLRIQITPARNCALIAPRLAALMIASAERSTDIGYDRLRALGLTNAESKLAAALLGGVSVIEYAKREGLAVPTVRAHLKRAMLRMGVNRQPEFIRKLMLVA
jgi:DNA-binding CsgD family transcriptional regulator